MTYILTDPKHYHLMLDNNASIDFVMMSSFFKYSIIIQFIYVMINLFSLMMTIKVYISGCRCTFINKQDKKNRLSKRLKLKHTMSKEVSKSIFNQVLFFLLLSVLEVPYFIIVVIRQMNLDTNDFKEQELKGILYFLYISRGLILPFIRILEP